MYDPDACLDSDEGACEGETHYRASLSGSGMSFPRCERHFELYLERVGPKLAEVRRRYPDTDVAPDWVDETYAGERWDDD